MMAKKKKKTELAKPSVTLSRDGYRFVLSFSSVDNDADYIWIERWVYEARDNNKSTKKQTEYDKIKLGAKSNSSWSFTLDKTNYYPFVKDGTADNPKQSDLDRIIDKIVFKVWLTGKKDISSKPVTKSYEFAPSVNPSVAISYNEDGASFTFGIDINDDYSIESTRKKVATRAWGYLTEQVYGGKETKVNGYKGKWYNRDAGVQIRKLITASISPPIPVKYTVYAYSAGPGGKSDTKSDCHVFAKPLAPMAPYIKRSNALEASDVDNGYGIYDVSWYIDTKDGWYPVDKVTIQYRDQERYKEDSDIDGEAMGAWSTARDNIHYSITNIQTDEIGAVASDNVRYFRLLVTHDGNKTPGYVTGVVGYGKPSSVSVISANAGTIIKSGDNGEREYVQVINFRWNVPSTKLYGTDPETIMYNGGKLGVGGRARILIFKNSTSTTPIKTIYCNGEGSSEWSGGEWVYEIPESDLDKSINYCFQLRVGLDNLNPGAVSDDVWVNNVIVPAKCKNVKGTKMADNTTVEVTWDNPTKDDTIRNGVQIAWSTFPNAWESNDSPSTVEFDDGAMTKAYITGLTAGEYYYFWVRRYEDNQNGDRNYGIWSDPSPGVILADKPNKPTLALSRSWIKEGGSLTAQWTYSASGNLPQIAASVSISSDGRVWDELAAIRGEDNKCSINLSEKVSYVSDSKLKTKYKYSAGRYFIRVGVLNSMGDKRSDGYELDIVTEPTCSLTSSSIVDYTYETYNNFGAVETTTVKALRKLPLTIEASGDGDLNLYVYSIDSREVEHPDNVENLFNGDCIWTSSIEAGEYSIENISLADNARYRIQLECVDPDTLLKSEPQYIDFEVHWEHQAVSPEQSSITINEDGTVTLIPIKPEGALDTDVCDIYRTTVDGRYLCRRDVVWGTTVTDKLPTFGNGIEHAYCFCTRTKDGDESWVDLVYELEGSGVIINYGNNEVRLPWNVTNDDGRTKKGEIRTHLGGTKTYYGQPGIERSHSLNAEIVKIDNEDIEKQLYDLSRFTELCYVRTSNGMGYPATVDVSVNREYNNKIVKVSLSVKEADGIDEFFGEIPSEEIVIS